MSEEKKLPAAARGFLVVVGLIADSTKLILDLTLGIGFILDPLFISPAAFVVFWITLNHNGVPMFSGRQSWLGWANLAVAEAPGIDALPDWTVYALSIR